MGRGRRITPSRISPPTRRRSRARSTQRAGKRPIAIGASLGGIASLLAEGKAERAGQGPVFAAIVLVDITPRVEPRAASPRSRASCASARREGFATVAEAADAVAAYLPHRPRPRSHDGLEEEPAPASGRALALALGPARAARASARSRIDHRILEAALIEAAKAITIPALLVRGGSSELVQEAHVREFLELVPHADYIDVAEARHMVAGDANDRFSDAVLDFVGEAGGANAWRAHS